jgi:hypothetical protein
MAYQKQYKDEINVYDLIARFNELGYRSLKAFSSNKKITSIVVEIKDGVEVEFTIKEKNKLNFELHLPYSWKRRLLQWLIALVLLVVFSILSKESKTKSDEQLIGLAFILRILFLLFASGVLPNWFAKNAYRAKHPNVLNDIAQELNEI